MTGTLGIRLRLGGVTSSRLSSITGGSVGVTSSRSNLKAPPESALGVILRLIKSLWVREHSCPSCGFELDRDWNAALNVLSRGLAKLGVVHSESTPVETALAVDATTVSAKRVTEAGSPCLKEPPKAANRQG